ncbi:hypothetical protein [uncultured Jatrophihabitans sp.]|uniref:hypothetical protein n=1 Tax=uncultured Jatrophihabitans sp. TaxID=1610747 RepID=UPI0035CA9E50
MRHIPTDLPRVLLPADLGRLGCTRSSLRNDIDRHGWRRLAPGAILTDPSGPRRTDWLVVGAHLAGDDCAVSGWDALDARALVQRVEPPPQVLVLARDGRHRRTEHVIVRPTERPFARIPLPNSQTDGHDLCMVGTARAVADTSLGMGELPTVRGIVTSAVQRGLCKPEALYDELCAGPRNGSALLRRAVTDVLGGARSVAEAEAVDALRLIELPPFEVNAPIFDAAGRRIAVADVLWRELLAIAEIDSREFHFNEQDWQNTMHRHNLLTAAGYAVAHWPPSAIRGREHEWADEVACWLQARSRELAGQQAR